MYLFVNFQICTPPPISPLGIKEEEEKEKREKRRGKREGKELQFNRRPEW
jgi:hypothetical protein